MGTVIKPETNTVTKYYNGNLSHTVGDIYNAVFAVLGPTNAFRLLIYSKQSQYYWDHNDYKFTHYIIGYFLWNYHAFIELKKLFLTVHFLKKLNILINK